MQWKIIIILFKVVDIDINMGVIVYKSLMCVLNVYFEPQNVHYNVHYSVNKVAYTFCDTILLCKLHSEGDVIVHTEEKPIRCYICE